MRLIYLQIFLLTIGTAFSQNNCDNYKDIDDYVPKDLNDALNYLNCTWSTKDKEEFKSKDEGDAVSELHMGTGQGIRNGWGLWEGKNSLYRSFKSKGIFHPDDISSIILTSFHRQLNNKDIRLEEQINEYKDYWEKAKREGTIEANKKKQTDKLEFQKYTIGDTVSMRFAQGNCGECLLLYKVQNENEPAPWRENEKTCIVKGIVRGKKLIKKYNYILVIEATDICGKKMAYHGDGEKDNLVVGKKFNYNISHFNITKD
jgi:hypothetical protein